MVVVCNMASTSSDGGFLGKLLNSISVSNPTLKNASDFIFKTVTQLAQRYEKIVIEEPERVAKFESMLGFCSFALPGQFKSSELLSELAYFATRMLSLLHDVIRRKRFSLIHDFLWTKKSYLELSLTVLEYTEVFIELGAARLWGEAGKWVVILIMQTVKAFLKIILLYSFDSGIQTSPSLPSVREKINLESRQQMKLQMDDDNSLVVEEKLHHAWKEANQEEGVSGKGRLGVWAGKRSGRMMRSLNNAPPKGFRDWRMPSKNVQKDDHSGIDYYKLKTRLSNDEKTAELAYILKPVAHLLCMFCYGETSWKPWLLSLAVDISSLHCLGSRKVLYGIERDELLKRKISMLMYLLRSPFYDKYSKTHIVRLLTALKDAIPGFGIFCRPLLEYLPVWQKMYSHTWSN